MTRAERIRIRATTPVDRVEERMAKASNGRTKLFLGAFDGGVMQRKLKGCVSDESPKGLRALGPIERVIDGLVWVCNAGDLVTGEPRGKRWILREGEGFRVVRQKPGVTT